MDGAGRASGSLSSARPARAWAGRPPRRWRATACASRSARAAAQALAATAAAIAGGRRRGRCRSRPISGAPTTSTRVIETTVATFGGLDILVTNTGGPPSGPFMTLGRERVDRRHRLAAPQRRPALPRRDSAHAGARRRPHHQHHVDLGEAADRGAGAVERAARGGDGTRARRCRWSSRRTTSS